MIRFNYKQTTTPEDRIKTYNSIRSRYIDKIPIVIEFDKKLHQPTMKVLIDSTAYVSELICFIRNKIKLSSEQAIYLSTEDHTILNQNQSLYLIHNSIIFNQKDQDNFLYIFVNCESVFG